MSDIDYLRDDIAVKLVEIEDLLKRWSLPTVTGITLVARDPNNEDKMHVILSNGGNDEMKAAGELLIRAANDD